MATTDDGFWETLHLLIEWKKTGKDARDDVDDWVNRVVARNEALAGNHEDDDFVSVRSDDRFSHDFEVTKEQEIKKLRKSVNLPPIECKFNHPQGRSRLERLMGSNMVSLTDRNYMQRLQHNIVQDYSQSMNQRIATRQEEELERIKNLVLGGKIPLEQAPPEMANHPVMLIENYCNKILSERRTKNKMRRLHLSSYLRCINTTDPPCSLGTGRTDPSRRKENSDFPPNGLADNEEGSQDDSYVQPEEFQIVKYESPLIKELKACETVEEMYALADQIIGVLKKVIGKREDLSDQTTTRSK